MRATLDLLADQHGHRDFALSYQPTNTVARRLYGRLGFVETGETEDDGRNLSLGAAGRSRSWSRVPNDLTRPRRRSRPS